MNRKSDNKTKYEYFVEELSDGSKIKLRVSDIMFIGNSLGQMQELVCIKCDGLKTSYSFVEKKVMKCTLCNGMGKYEVFCHVRNEYLHGD